MTCILVTGPTRSGKSEFAEQLARDRGLPVTYVATSLVAENDPEWRDRLQQHRQRRPSDWQLLEVPYRLADAIAAAPPDTCYLVDSLGTWVANAIDQPDPTWQRQEEQLRIALIHSPATIICVAEETGWGVVPAYPAGRSFRDRLGRLSRLVGSQSEALYLVVAGYALDLKLVGQPIAVTPGGSSGNPI